MATTDIERSQPQNTLTIIGALEDLGSTIASTGSSIGIDLIDVFGKEIINLTSEGVVSLIDEFFPGMNEKNITEITEEVRMKINLVILIIQEISKDEKLKEDINEILQLVTQSAGNMLVTIINDLEEPLDEAMEKIQESSEKIIVRMIKGVVRTTWDSFTAALAPVPVLGDVMPLIDVGNTIVSTALKVMPPAIKNAESLMTLGNNIVGTTIGALNSELNTFNQVKRKGTNVVSEIEKIQARIAQSIAGVTKGIKDLNPDGKVKAFTGKAITNLKSDALSGQKTRRKAIQSQSKKKGGRNKKRNKRKLTRRLTR